MKHLKTIFYILSIVISIMVVVSCSDDDDNKEEIPQKVLLPEEMVMKINESTMKTSFTYDDRNRIISRIEEGAYLDTIKITYEGDKVLSIYHSWTNGNVPLVSETMLCSYGNNISFEAKVFENKVYTFGVDSKGQVTSYAWYDLLYNFEYDDKGNIQSEKKNEDGEMYGTATYTYTDKPSIFCNQNTPKWLLMYLGYQNEFVNSPQKIEHHFDTKYRDIRMEYTYEFADDMPVTKELKRYESDQLSSTETYTIKYISVDKK